METFHVNYLYIGYQIQVKKIITHLRIVCNRVVAPLAFGVT